jgi:hypothetical protein
MRGFERRVRQQRERVLEIVKEDRLGNWPGGQVANFLQLAI